MIVLLLMLSVHHFTTTHASLGRTLVLYCIVLFYCTYMYFCILTVHSNMRRQWYSHHWHIMPAQPHSIQSQSVQSTLQTQCGVWGQWEGWILC